ncbi:ring-cleaving dioxygenase [Pedobacter heparinus]|uniref:Glyoxalase/bleomycin resistance protein/dioxygenase n=1 Tax=Pedobacter heparinus (strain ATCC 13125 / DSM 2366 / CIP 104194 / JCM 7457 / NBRC 12017 / NCIMB 9290 / NRRL B-14731 / HIM 762-3) TaxID=485917 RepID=C6XUP7_PEDHD|nr:ring-cleaving dioxygenase [Pedobacter heparinus]ACU03897.1 Glyoxalase/bleomycin resistance protein/dioxygenase [Pedobacter heparinus DSM 2366]
MNNEILGIHHITAIAGNAKRNYDFYTGILGLRLIKKTVNFDDPHTYHFYYGDEKGTPGSILTFFPWEGIQAGRRGTKQVTEIGYSVPAGSLEFWQNRFEQHNIIYNKPAVKFGERYLTFLDPDGLKFELTEAKVKDNRPQWETAGVDKTNAVHGFHHITSTTNKMEGTAAVLTTIFGYRLAESEVNRHRFITDTVEQAAIVDLVEAPGEAIGHVAGGSVHHVAFRVKDEATLMYFRDKIVEMGLNITEKIDRNYFYSLYFREPGGVLFEIATDNPGFTIDEPLAELGSNLKLPAQYESIRTEIEGILPQLS